MAEKNSDKKLEEANFEVSSLAEVKDENGNGIFHMKLKTKIILFVSILILLAAGALIYLFFEKYINAEIWQVAVWGLWLNCDLFNFCKVNFINAFEFNFICRIVFLADLAIRL